MARLALGREGHEGGDHHLVESQGIPTVLDMEEPGTAPRYLLRDRDSCYGEQFHSTTRAMGIHEVLTAPRSPWQNAFVERLIGSIRRECLDHVLTFNERGLRRILRSYFDYYERLRTHLALNKDAPVPRAVQPPATGRVIAVPQVGGLHHRYKRQTAQRAA